MNDTPSARNEEQVTPFQIIILALSIYVLAALLVQTLSRLSPATETLLNYIDTGICLVFIYDFFMRLYLAPRKAAFLKWNWIDLVASVPAVGILRWGRMLRIVRLLRILRAFRSTKVLVLFLFRHRASGTFATVALISIVLTIFSSIAVLNFETTPESNIKTPGDALWWSLVTVTTVGYGDKYPVTPEGRVVAVFLMVAGVGLFGTFTGCVATFFLKSEQKKEEGEIQALAKDIRALREKIESLERKP